MSTIENENLNSNYYNKYSSSSNNSSSYSNSNSSYSSSSSSTYYSKNIKSISSDDYQGVKHLKSISSENVSTSSSSHTNYKNKPPVKHYIPRSKRNLKVNQNSHHFKSQQQANYITNSNYSNSNMIKSFSSDGNTSPSASSPKPNGQPSSGDSPTNKSRMKRLSLTVSVSTQMYLEKISKNPSSLDSEDIKKLKSLLHDQKVDYSKFTKNSKSTIFAFDKFNHGVSFGEAVFAFGEGGSLKDSVEGEALRELGNQIQDIENVKKDAVCGSIQTLIEPLTSFYEDDIKKAREVKRKQNVGRIKFEQASNNLNEVRKKSDPLSSKTKLAKTEEENHRNTYNQLTKEFSETMIDNDKKMKIELRKLIREYVAYQMEYFRECLESWEEFAEDLDEILPSDQSNHVDSPLSKKANHYTAATSNKKKTQVKKGNGYEENDNEDDDDSGNDDDLLNQI